MLRVLVWISTILMPIQTFCITSVIESNEAIYRKIIYEDSPNGYNDLLDLFNKIPKDQIESEYSNGLLLSIAEISKNNFKSETYEKIYNHLIKKNREFVKYEWEMDYYGNKVRFLKVIGWTEPELFGVKTMESHGVKCEGDIEDAHLSVGLHSYGSHYQEYLIKYSPYFRKVLDFKTSQLIINESYGNKFLDFFLEYFAYEDENPEHFDEEGITNKWRSLINKGCNLVDDAKFKGKSFYYMGLYKIAQFELLNAIKENPFDEEISNFLVATKNELLIEQKGETSYKYFNFPNDWTKTKSQNLSEGKTTTNLYYDLNQDGSLDELVFLFPLKSNVNFKLHSLFIFLNDGKGSLKYSQRIDINQCKFGDYHKNNIMFGSLFYKYTKPSGGPIVGLTSIPGKDEFYRYIPNLLKWDKTLNKVVTQGIEPWINFF